MANFIIQIVEGSARTPLGLIDDEAGAEIYAQVDSTPAIPLSSTVKEIEISLPSGLYSNNVDVSFEGPSAAYWELTATDPEDNGSPTTWLSNIQGQTVDYSVQPTVPLRLWVRAATYEGEAPANDRTTPLRVEGRQNAR